MRWLVVWSWAEDWELCSTSAYHKATKPGSQGSGMRHIARKRQHKKHPQTSKIIILKVKAPLEVGTENLRKHYSEPSQQEPPSQLGYQQCLRRQTRPCAQCWWSRHPQQKHHLKPVGNHLPKRKARKITVDHLSRHMLPNLSRMP